MPIPTTNFGVTPTDALGECAWDTRAVSATSSLVNTAALEDWIQTGASMASAHLESLGVDKDMLTDDPAHAAALGIIQESIRLYAALRATERLGELGDAADALRDRLGAAEDKMKSYNFPPLGEAQQPSVPSGRVF